MNLNGAHLHLMLVHFPIAGTILAVPLLLAAWFLRNETVKLVGLSLVVVLGLAVWAADKTGGMAAGVVRDLPDIQRSDIREHAMAAEWGLRALGLNALVAAYGLFAAWKTKKLPHWVFVTVTLLAIWGSTVIARVGYLGGMIHHPETKADYNAPAAAQSPAPTPAAPAK